MIKHIKSTTFAVTFFLPFLMFLNEPNNSKRLSEEKPKESSINIMMEICDNGIDDDGDGLIDCYDNDCFTSSDCDNFYYGGTVLPCTFVPPVVPQFELELVFCTDFENYPIDQRCSAFVGDLDGDGIPEIVANDPSPGRIQIFSGVDGSIKQSIVVENNHPFSQLAIADVDKNGIGDIFRNENGSNVARYEYGNPNPVWKTADGDGDNTTYSDPQIADFDGDGVPEVYLGSRILNSLTGTRLAVGGQNQGIHRSGDRYTLAYDIFKPGDAKPGGGTFGAEAAGLELLAGNQVYTVELGNGTMDNGTLTVVSEVNGPNIGDGFVSIGDLDADGKIDLIIMDGGKVYAWNPRTETQIGTTFDVAGTSAGGRINVGDFDNDGMLEMGFAGRNIYYVLEYDGTALVEKWRKTGLDDGSERTGSTLFDFEGDGSNEVVYREEGHLYVLDGATGAELAKIPSEAGTRTEYPLVADVNNDGAAEVILTAQNGNGPGFSGNDFVCVYRSKASPWVSARPVWNQHGYFNTNINDDLTVPEVQQDILNPAFGNAFNGFLVQSTILSAGSTPAFAASDGTLELLSIGINACPDLDIQMKVDNIGSADFPAGTPIAFYDSDPTTAAANLLGTTTIPTTIPESGTSTFNFTLDIGSLVTPIDIYAVVNDTGFVASNLPYDLSTDFPVTGTPECDFTNNIDRMRSGICLEICDDGLDNDTDGLIDEPNITSGRITGCSGDMLPQMTIDITGGTWTVISSIGTTVDASGNVILGNNFSPTPDFDTIIYDATPCNDTVFVSVFDDQSPILACPGDRTLAVNASCNARLTDYLGEVSFKDNCSANADIKLSQNPVSGTVIGLGVTTVTVDAADESGNMSQCTFEVKGVDFIDPTISCPSDILTQVDNSCNFSMADYTGGATVADNCSLPANIRIDQLPGAGTILSGHGATQTVVLTAYDESGNTAQCSFEITLEDLVDPTVTCPENQTLQTDAFCEAQLQDYTSLATCGDNCTPKNLVAISQTPAVGTTMSSDGASTVITIAVDDGNGNTANCNFTVTLEDNIDPTIACPSNKNIDVDGSCNFTLADYTSQATVSDNCTAEASIAITQSPVFATVISGHGTTQIVTLTADDGNGNTQDCTFTITLDDPVLPTITCPADVLQDSDVNCEITIGDYTGSAVSADNCSAPANITVTQSPPAGTMVRGINRLETIALTAEDEAGNTAFCQFNIRLRDVIDPVIVCPGDQNINVSGSCSIDLPDYTSSVSPTDNCVGNNNITVVQSPAAGTVLTGDGTMQIVTLTAEDRSSNTAQCTFTVTLVDNTVPAITCPANENVRTNTVCRFRVLDYTSEAVVVGVCDPGSAFTVTQSPPSGTLLTGVGTVQTVTLTADDMNGQMNSCTFQLTLVDERNPTITCPDNTSINLDGNCETSVIDYTTSATVADNCSAVGDITIIQDPVVGTTLSGHGILHNITLTAEDEYGNNSQCDFFISLNDTAPPSIICPVDQAEITNGSCEVIIPSYVSSSTVADNCTLTGTIAVTQSPLAGTVLTGANVVQVITLTADDGNGNTNDCTFNLTTNDTTVPLINCPVDQDLDLDINCQAALPDFTSVSTFSDNCEASGTVTVSQSPVPGSIISVAGTTQIVTLTANDGNGNTANCTFQITAADVTDPALTCPSDQPVSLDASCQISFPDYTSSAIVSDNCTAPGSIVLTQSPAPTTILTGAETVVSVTITANDGNGNTISCSFNVTLDDDADPALTCPVNQNVYVDGTCTYLLPDYGPGLSASDNCTTLADLIIQQTPAADTILMGHNLVQPVSVTTNDGNGNIVQCNFSITLLDTISPTIICPADADISVDASCSISLGDYTNSANIADNCTLPGNITLTQNPIAGTILSTADFMQDITITANDGNGNTKQCVFTLTLKDDTAPSVSCPDNQVVNPDATCDISLPDFTTLLTTTDNCSTNSNIVVTQSPVATTTFSGNGTVETITLTATDESGNEVDCTFNITISDNIPPTITCPANQTINPDANCEFIVPSYFSSATYSDNCTSAGALGLSQVLQAGTVIFGDGTVETITITVDDGNGNSASCSFDITLDDNTPPAVTCPAAQTIGIDDVCSVPLPDYTSSAGVADNCGKPADFTVTQLPLAGTNYSGDGTVISVTLTANDGNGNSNTCTFDVTLVDMVAPALTCPGNQDFFADGTCMVTIPDFTATAAVTNQCMMGSGIALSQVPLAGTVLTGHGTIQTITITADDGSGNMTPCSFDVMVRDTTPPALVCPSNYMEQADDNCQFDVPNYTDSVTVSDNCTVPANLTMTQTPLENSLLTGFGIPHSVEVTAVDEVGNISTCEFTVTLADDFPPFIGCPDDQEISLDLDCSGLVPNYTSLAVKTDNCNNPVDITITQLPMPGSPLIGHNTSQTITLTADDGSGGVSSCTFEVTFLDETLPEISCPGDVTVALDASCEFDLPDYTGGASVTDNCTLNTNITVTQAPAVGSTVAGHEVIQIITLTANDGNGNTFDCTFEIELLDNIAPIVVCPSDDILAVDANCEIILPDYRSDATLSDNCAMNGDVTISQVPAPGTVYSDHGFSETITLSFDDENGNTSQCDFMITLDDDTAPSINCPVNQSIFLDVDCEVNLPDYTGAATLADNCSALAMIATTQSPAIGTLFSGTPDTITVTLTANDGNGNTADCTFDVGILDVTLPTIACPANYGIDLTGVCEYLLPDLTGDIIGQNECSGDQTLTITQSPIAGTVLQGLQQVHVISFTATDNSGNASTCNFQLTLNDKVAPQFTCPDDKVITGNGCEYALPDYIQNIVVTDNCYPASDVTLTQTPLPTVILTNGVHTIQIEATDAQGNVGQCDFDLTVDLREPCPSVGIKINGSR